MSISTRALGIVIVGLLLLPQIAKAEAPPAFLLKWGPTVPGMGELDYPFGVAVDTSGNVYVVSNYSETHVIDKFDPNGNFLDTIGRGNFTEPYASPLGVTVDRAGNVFAGDYFKGFVKQFSSGGSYIQTFWGMFRPYDMAVDPSGQFLYVTDMAAPGWIRKFVIANGDSPPITSWTVHYPGGVAVDTAGNVYVACGDGNRIEVFTADGAWIRGWATTGTNYGIDVDDVGDVYITNMGTNSVQKFNAYGDLLVEWGTPGTGNGQFNGPAGIAVDANRNIYVADCYNHRMQKFRAEDTVAIIVPDEDAIVSETVAIIGTANRISFDYYCVEIGIGDAPVSWLEIARDSYPIYAGLLANWNTTLFPEGYNHIRLKAVGTDGSELILDRRIIVNNHPPVLTVDATPQLALPGPVTITINVSEPLKQLPIIALMLPGGDTVWLIPIQTGATSYQATYIVTVDDPSGEAIVLVSVIDLGDSPATGSATFTIHTDFLQCPAATVSASGFTDWVNSGHLVFSDGQSSPIGISTSDHFTNKAGWVYTLLYSYAAYPSAAPMNLRANHLLCNGIIVADQTPAISWDFAGGGDDAQTAYEVQLSGDPGFTVVDNASGIILSAKPEYSGAFLFEEKVYYVRVRVKNNYGMWSEWTSGTDSFILDVDFPSTGLSVVTASGFMDWQDSGHLIFCDGQPTPIGISASNQYTNKAGYLYTLLYQYIAIKPLLPANLRANGKICRGEFVADLSPELTWDFNSTMGDRQLAYESRIALDPSFAVLVDSSGIALTATSSWVAADLAESVPYFVRIRVKNDYGIWSEWTDGNDSFILDATPPESMRAIDPPFERFGADTWLVYPETRFRFTATDTLSGVANIQYRIDEGNWNDWLGADISLMGFNAGIHAVDYRAIDRAGAIEAWHRVWDVLDTRPVGLMVNPPDPGSIAVEYNANAGAPLETVILGYEVTRPCAMNITATNVATSFSLTLFSDTLSAGGIHRLLWDGSDMAASPTYLDPGEYLIEFTAAAGGNTTTGTATVTLTGGDSKAVISQVVNSPSILNIDQSSGDSIEFTLHTWNPPDNPMDFTELKLFKENSLLVYSQILANLPASRTGVAQILLCPDTAFPEVGIYTYAIDARYQSGSGLWCSANTRQGTILVIDDVMTASSVAGVTVWHDTNDSIAIKISPIGYQTVTEGGRYQSDRFDITATAPLTRPAYVIFDYDTELYAGKLGLKKTDGAGWHDVTTVADEQNTCLIGKLESLSTVAIFVRVLEDWEPPQITNVEFNPRGISPGNADGLNDNLEISYQVTDDFSRYLPQTSLAIYDQDNHLVRTLVDKERRSLIIREFWEGRDNNHALAPVGSYRVVASVTDHSGKITSEMIGSMLIDDIPPVISLIQPVSPANQPVTLHYQVSDNLSPSERITVIGDNSPYGTEGNHLVTLIACDEANNTATVTSAFVIDLTPPHLVIEPISSPTNHSVTLAWTVTDNYSQNIHVTGDESPYSAEGEYTVHLRAVDEAGNETIATVAFVIDKTPPVIAGLTTTPKIFSPDGNGVDEQTEIGFAFADDRFMYPGSLKVGVWDGTDTLVREVLNAAPAAYGVRTVVWDGMDADGRSVEAGMYRVAVMGADAAGNLVQAETSVTVQYDVTSPEIGAIVPGVNSIYSYASAFILQWTVADTESGVASSSAILDGVAVSSGQTVDLKVLGIGSHTLLIQAQDNAGNAATITVPFSVIDDVPPVITLTQPATPTKQNVTLRYVAYDEISDTAHLTIGGDQGPYTAEGYYTVALTVTDEAGNSTTSNEVCFSIDKTAPVTTLTVGTPNYTDYIATSTPLTLAATDNMPGVAVSRYQIDDGSWQSYAGPFTIAGDGVHTISYQSEDAAGNVEAVNTRTFRVDSSAPTSVLIADLTDSTGTVAVPETKITITANDAGVGLEKIEYRINNSAWTDYAAPFELRDVTGLGSVNIGFRSADRLGNTEPEKTITYKVKPALVLLAGLLASPRVLCWWNEPDGGVGHPSRAEWTAALAVVLDSPVLDYRIVESAADFIGGLADYNVYLILGDDTKLDELGDSLVVAQLTAGKTIISFGYDGIQTPQPDDQDWENIFGIKVAGVLNGTALLALRQSPINGETQAVFIEGQTKRITRILSGDVWGEVALTEFDERGGRSQGQGQGDGGHKTDTYPAIIANMCGNGRALYLVPEYNRNLAVLTDLLHNAIMWSAPQQELVVPGGLIGVRIKVKNAVLPLVLRVNIESLLPAGSDAVMVYDGGEDRGSYVVWFDDLPENVSHDYRFLLRLPSTPGSYTIRVEVSYLKAGHYRLVDDYKLVVTTE